MAQVPDSHLTAVINSITNDELVFFLGAGANRCGRPPGIEWKPRDQYLPDGAELAAYLAKTFRYPSKDVWDLLRISQYVDIMQGTGSLYKKLRHVFDADYYITPLHHFLARLPEMLRDKGYPFHLLIVTTNYDDVLEKAFEKAGESYDLVTYVADASPQASDRRGKYMHRKPGGLDPELVLLPNEYGGLSLDERPAILKIHGAVDRGNESHDSYVITENHYIDYLTHTDISLTAPVELVEKLTTSNILFLGYSLRDWNLRAILRRIWSEQKLSFKSWAIQLNPDELEREFWEKHGDIKIIDSDLALYVALLEAQLRELLPAGD